MPSVDPITPPSSTTAGTTGLFGALVPQQASGLFGELMAAVTGIFGEAAGATPSTDAEPTTTTTSTQTTGQRRRTLLDIDTGSTDLAAALAVLAGGANQTPALSAALASPASLGAAADTRSRTSDPSTAIGAPTAATGFATQTPTTTGSTTAATTASGTSTSVAATTAAAAAAATAPRASTPAATPTPATPVTDTASPTPTTTGAPTSALAAAVAGSVGSAATTTNTTAATASTATAADQALPPALASAIAGATGVATMPSALRHLSGTRVSGATTTTGSTAPASSEASATSASTTATDVAVKSTEAAATADTPAPVIHTAAEPRSAARGETAAAPIHAETGRGVAEARGPIAEATGRSDAATPVATTDRPAAGVDADRRERAGAEAPVDGRASLDQPLLAVTGETGRDRISTAQTVREAASDPTRATTTLAQLPEAIAARSSAGHSRFDIRLSPAELGSVDVRVEVRASGEVRAHLVVERTETLDLMLRDQKHLERSLSDAGLDVGSSGLQFSLRQQPSGENGQGWRTYDDATVRPERVADEEAEAAVAPIAAAAYRSTRIGGVDLRV